MKKYKNVIIALLSITILGLVIGLGFGANYLYNLALNPDTPKDIQVL